jgi:repressor LexA
MKLGEIVKKYRQEHDLSQRQFAKLCGLSHGYIPLIEKGLNPNGDPLTPSITVMKQLADAMGLTLHELISLSDEDMQVDLSYEANRPWESVPDLMPIRRKAFPLLGEITCGEPAYAEEQHETMVESTEAIDADFCLRAKGDSMSGSQIDDGDIVFIKQMPMVDNGDIAAVLIDNETTLKRVDYDPDAGILILMPDNPAYRPLVYKGEELNRIRILGRAVMIQKVIRKR